MRADRQDSTAGRQVPADRADSVPLGNGPASDTLDLDRVQVFGNTRLASREIRVKAKSTNSGGGWHDGRYIGFSPCSFQSSHVPNTRNHGAEMEDDMDKLERDTEPNNGWTIKFSILKALREQAQEMNENPTEEEVEAVALAMVDLGYALIERPTQPDIDRFLSNLRKVWSTDK